MSPQCSNNYAQWKLISIWQPCSTCTAMTSADLASTLDNIDSYDMMITQRRIPYLETTKTYRHLDIMCG